MGWWWVAIGFGALVIVAAVVVVLMRHRRRRNTLVSIVMLSETPREISESMVRGAARRALGGDVEVVSLPTPEELGIVGLVVNSIEHGMYYVISSTRPYVEDPEADSAMYENEHAREAFAKHKAWISVDATGGLPKKDQIDSVMKCVARLAAELLDDSCSMLYATATERVALNGPGIEAKLRGDDPLSIFGDDEVNTPIIHVDKSLAAVNKAMETARKRWPEFVEAFARIGPDGNALVKGKFCEGEESEYMWVKAESANAQNATGVLLNSPAHVKSIKKGHRVTIQFEDIADWAFMEKGEQKGMFVERILRNG